MKNFLVSLYFLLPTIFTIILVLLTPIPSAQLTNSETRILLQLVIPSFRVAEFQARTVEVSSMDDVTQSFHQDQPPQVIGCHIKL